MHLARIEYITCIMRFTATDDPVARRVCSFVKRLRHANRLLIHETLAKYIHVFVTAVVICERIAGLCVTLLSADLAPFNCVSRVRSLTVTSRN